MKGYKHLHGTKNPVLMQEENAILVDVQRALASSPNSQTIGRNGEIPFLKFLQRYLPSPLRATSGHFITPAGVISPQIDVMVIDARYPLLAENADGSVLTMLHSVVHAYEVKTNLIPKEVKISIERAEKSAALFGEVKEFYENDSWKAPKLSLLAYKASQRIEAIEDAFFDRANPLKACIDLVLLRFNEKDLKSRTGSGCILHLEPPFPGRKGKGPLAGGFFPLSIPSHTPLSDLYYGLVQDSYYTIGARNYSLTEIGAQFNSYMSWATAR